MDTKPEMTKFMMSKVEPDTAAAINLKPYDPATKNGLRLRRLSPARGITTLEKRELFVRRALRARREIDRARGAVTENVDDGVACTLAHCAESDVWFVVHLREVTEKIFETPPRVISPASDAACAFER